MKQKLLFACFVLLFIIQKVTAQNGYIYVHQKTLNEQAVGVFPYVLTNSSGTTVASFNLNNNPSWIQLGDIGASHDATNTGTSGNGELWVIGSSGSAAYDVSPIGLTGTVYHRLSGSSDWAAVNTGVTTTLCIDGAYSNQYVYSTGTNVSFYNAGTVTTLTALANVTDVSAGGGYIAVIAGGILYQYSTQYTTSAAPAAGTWTNLNTGYTLTTSTTSRVDINFGGTLIAYTYSTGFNGTETVSTIGTTTHAKLTVGTFTSSTDAYGNTVGGGSTNPEVAFGDNGTLYCIATSIIYNAGDCVFSNVTGSFVYEPQSRLLERITASSNGQAWGVLGTGTQNNIWTRSMDGTHIWIDDERVRLNGTGTAFKTGGGSGTGNTNTGVGVTDGDAIMIPVTAGTYTLTETLPTNLNWDLGRYTTYVPSTSSITTNVSTQQITVTIAAGDVVHLMYYNESLSPSSIPLNCTTSTLQDFGTGTNVFGDTVQGTAYHYYPQGNTGTPSSTPPQDGDYFVVQSLTPWFVNNGLQSHTNAGTGYFLVVNASYALDEFYRKRVTGLVQGIQYKITFYAANINFTTGTTVVRIPPNVLYGMQDVNGNILASSSTGSIDTLGPSTWIGYSFTFTATTSQADFFLRNNTIGGLGNDIALDDIALNPVLTTLGSNTESPTVAPNLCIGSTYTFSNTVSGGTWSSSNPTVARVTNSNTGKVLTTGAGTVTISYSYLNAVGCTSTSGSTLTAIAPPGVTASDKFAGVLCLNSKDSLYSTESSLVGTPTYTWSASPSAGAGLGTTNTQNSTATPTVSGSYTYIIVVTDGTTGCSASASVPVTVSTNTAPTVTAAASAPQACYNVSINLSSTVSGGSGWTYKWTGSGVTTTTTQNTTATPTTTGIYTVVVDDLQGCNTFATTASVISDPQITATASSSPSSICLGQTSTLSGSASGGTTGYTYGWSSASTGAGLGTTNTQNTTAKPTSMAPSPKSYTLTVTDALSCTATATTTIAVSVVANDITVTASASPTTVCSGSTVGLTATAGGTGALTASYSWSGSGTISPNNSTSASTATATPTATGAYTVIATDVLGCTASATTASVAVNPAPTVTASVTWPTKICSGEKLPLLATVTGGSGTISSYTWSATTKPSATTVSFSPNGTSAASSSNATFTVSTGQTGTFAFQVIATDANGCTATGTSTSPSLTTSPTSVATLAATAGVSAACKGQTSIVLTATRGTSASPYNYTWSGPSSTYSGGTVGSNPYATSTTPSTINAVPISTATSGVYTVTLIDGNACTNTAQTTTVTMNTPPTVAAIAAGTATCTGSSDSIPLIATPTEGSGTSISTYLWTGTTGGGLGATNTATVNALPSTNGPYSYSVTITDNNGCTASGTTNLITAASSPGITAVASLATTDCTGQLINLTGTITTTTTSPYTYTWTSPSNSVVSPATTISTTATTNTATGTTTSSGNYIYGLQVTDNNGCVTGIATNEEVIDTVPSASLAVSSNSVCANPASTINLTGAITYSTTSPYTYSWAGSGISNVNATTTTAIPTTTYLDSFEVKDANGCVGVGTQTVTVDQATPILSNPCNSTTPPYYSQVYDSYGYLWTWTFTTTTGDIFYTTSAYSRLTDSSTSHLQGPFIVYTGVYTVTNKDASGCIGTGNLTVSACGLLLSAKLLNFTAQKVQGTTLLNWTTASELDNNYFDIERSPDGINWGNIGIVNSLGNSQVNQNYTYTDVSPLNGNNYYRLRIVDVNGTATYSDVKLVNFAGLWTVRMYPNPASDYLVLEFDNNKDEKANLIIETALGSKIFIKPQDIIKGHNVITLHQVQPLAQGTYFITLQTTTNTYRSKFVKGDSN